MFCHSSRVSVSMSSHHFPIHHVYEFLVSLCTTDWPTEFQSVYMSFHFYSWPGLWHHISRYARIIHWGYKAANLNLLCLHIRGSHTTSESAFILREWARGEAQLVVWWRGRFIFLLRRRRGIFHSPRMKIQSSAPVFHLFAAALLHLFDFLSAISCFCRLRCRYSQQIQ